MENGNAAENSGMVGKLIQVGHAAGVDIARRVLEISKQLVGKPYRSAGLAGSPVENERLISDLGGFDCVTFVEAVVALSRSSTEREFNGELAALRYKEGKVGYFERNHYMVDWVERNSARGVVRDLTLTLPNLTLKRTISYLKDIPSSEREIHFIPVQVFLSNLNLVQGGDLIFFGTTTDNLDVRHMGFLVRDNGGGLILRHATKFKDAVVDEQLDAFLVRYGECPGIWWARCAACSK